MKASAGLVFQGNLPGKPMSDDTSTYLFYVHGLVPAWRLVLIAQREHPPQMIANDWVFTRERTAIDTNPDVRAVCAEKGFCLFKLGGEFADVMDDTKS